MIENGRRLRAESASKGRICRKSERILADSTPEVLYNTVSWVHEVGGKSCEILIIANGVPFMTLHKRRKIS